MAIVVLVLWLFTAGAGFYLLVTSNLGRARPAPVPAAPVPKAPATSAPATPAPAASAAAPAAQRPATTTEPAPAAHSAPQAQATAQAQAAAAAPAPASKRELRRAARDRFDPPSLTAAKNAPVLPGLRSLFEFAHPACAIVGLGFWLAYTLVHYHPLGWIAFGLVTATVCLGLSWFTANARAARTHGAPGDEPSPSFRTRLVVLHGGAAAVTFTLAALTALVLGRLARQTAASGQCTRLPARIGGDERPPSLGAFVVGSMITAAACTDHYPGLRGAVPGGSASQTLVSSQ
jgi:hypothetical protein